MILIALFFALSIGASGSTSWSLERLFTRPFVWGTRPDNITWSKRGHTLLFTWNAQGGHFMDLYAYHPDRAKLVRLTDLEHAEDALNLTATEKDSRQKRYAPPRGGIEGFDLSDDGSQAIFALKGDLYLIKMDGSGPSFRLTRTRAVESSPQLSPDGKKAAFLRGGQLFTVDLSSGQLWQVTNIEGASDSLASYGWAHDGHKFFYTVYSGSERKLLLPNYSGRVVTARSFERSLAGDSPQEIRTYVIGSDGSDAKAIEPGPWGNNVYVENDPLWSPDSTRLLQVVIQPDLNKAQVLVQHAMTGKSAVLAEESDAAWVEPMFATWSPDSRSVLFTSERDGWSHLFVIGIEGGKPQQLTRGPWEIHTERLFARDPQWIGNNIYYSSTEVSTAERQFYRIRPDGSSKQRISSREGLHVGVVSEDGLFRAILAADLKNPFDLFVGPVSASDESLQRVTTSTRAEFQQYAWPETRFVTFPSRRDGKPVAAKILLPSGYRLEDRNQKPWPAVFFIHGSGYATSVLKQWGSYQEQRFVFNCYLAHKGYVVIDPDYRGSSGYGRDWRTDVYQHLGGADLDDVLGAVDYLRSLGNIDMRRIGIWGSSYGGFMTGMAMFLSPDTFRAGAAFAAVNDWENYNAFYTEQRLNKPQDHPEAYRRSSPIHFSSLLKNPLLIVHGMVDSNVMFQDAVQLAEKLIHEGKDFSQIYYPEENHILLREESLIDAFRRAAEFFDRHLQ